MDALHQNELEHQLDAGKLMSNENYIASKDLVPGLQSLVDELNPELVKARGLTKFLEVDRDFLFRVVCLPTTVLMSIRHLVGDRSLTLRDFYELGIYSQINDRKVNDTDEKGFPSFHYKMMDTYLRYALEFAKVAGLHGGIFTEFSNLGFIKDVLRTGVMLVSVNNLFIPDVMNPNLDETQFRPSRHAELVHAAVADKLVISDVTNNMQGQLWETRNRLVPRSKVEEHLVSPGLQDFFTRGVILTKDQASWEQLAAQLADQGKIVEQNFNPILKPFFGQGVSTALESIRAKAQSGLAQWDMID